jgi:hypothetical protein
MAWVEREMELGKGERNGGEGRGRGGRVMINVRKDGGRWNVRNKKRPPQNWVF